MTYSNYLAANFYLYSSYPLGYTPTFYFTNICDLQDLLPKRLDLGNNQKTIPSTSYHCEILA